MTGSKTRPAALSIETLAMIRRLFAEHGRQHAAAYLFAGLAMAVGAAATALSAYLLKPVLNHMVEPGGFESLKLLSLYIAVLFLLRGCVTYLSLVVLARTGNRIVARIQARLFEHLIRQNMRFYQDRHSSEFMTRLALAANSIRDILQVLIMSAGRDVLTLCGLIAVMIVQDPIMALIAVSLMPVGAYGLSRLIRRVRLFARRSFDGSTRVLEILQETLQGIRIVKSFNLEAVMGARMQAAVSEVEGSANRMSAGMAVSSPLADTFGGFAIAIVILYGSWRVTSAHADPGAFFSFIAALLLAYEPAKRLARLNLEIQTGLVGANLIYEVLDRPAAELMAAARPPLDVRLGRISFDKVRFGYRAHETVLDGLDLVVEASATTALVGASGSGKSTILSLIQRFFDAEDGRILIDGQDVTQVDLASLRSKIGFVSQDVFLFRGSIGENLGLGRPGASQAEIIAAARKANAHDFITGFSAGYATPVGEQGLQLSAGQRQRIAIARAILKDAPILLLDEPTAALDPESEREVQTALAELRCGRTTIVVAHRLHTIVAADCVHVIDKGRVVESGTHADLIERRGHYHAFFIAQFEASKELPASKEMPVRA